MNFRNNCYFNCLKSIIASKNMALIELSDTSMVSVVHPQKPAIIPEQKYTFRKETWPSPLLFFSKNGVWFMLFMFSNKNASTWCVSFKISKQPPIFHIFFAGLQGVCWGSNCLACTLVATQGLPCYRIWTSWSHQKNQSHRALGWTPGSQAKIDILDALDKYIFMYIMCMYMYTNMSIESINLYIHTWHILYILFCIRVFVVLVVVVFVGVTVAVTFVLRVVLWVCCCDRCCYFT